MTMPTGLAHRWLFDEASGSSVLDTVGDLGTGTVTGTDPEGSVVAGGPNGYYRNLDNGPNRIQLWTGTEDLTYELSAWTIAILVRRSEPTEYGTAIFQVFDNDVGMWVSVMTSEAEAEITVLVNDTVAGGEYIDVNNYTPALFNDTWRLVSLTQDGSTVRMYDGDTLMGSVGADTPLRPKAAGFWVGHESYQGPNMFSTAGMLVFDRALSSAELGDLYTELTTEPPPPPFEEPEWVSLVDPVLSQIYYVCDIDDGILDPVRVPISSWQGTLQDGRSSFLQAIVPGITAHTAAIAARPNAEFIISRGVILPDGTLQEVEMARAPLALRSDGGPTNNTGTLSGYAVLAFGVTKTRTLQHLRSRSEQGSTERYRCSIDFFLRPGDTAVTPDGSFVVSYINYIVGTSDQYMDVGSRAL